METNHYQFGYRYNLSRNLTQGSALDSVALLLGYPRVYLPAAYSYSQLIPLGSHPLTDPLYSNECVEIVHDGAEARRVDKVRKIAECEPALPSLTVCLEDMNVNCGKCSKCLRTMIPLKLLNASSEAFPPFSKRNSKNAHQRRFFFKENLDLAVQSENWELHDALNACMTRYEKVKILKEIDRVLLGDIIKRTYRKIKGKLPDTRRIDTTPPRD